MLRHEYADHVAALVCAELAGVHAGMGGNFTPGVRESIAAEASALGDALAAVRFPNDRDYHDARDLGDT